MTAEEREKAKRVTYGIVYGLSAWGLAKGPAGLGIEVAQAHTLISSFLNHFKGVQTVTSYTLSQSPLSLQLEYHQARCEAYPVLPTDRLVMFHAMMFQEVLTLQHRCQCMSDARRVLQSFTRIHHSSAAYTRYNEQQYNEQQQ